jgi:hypothetical protein
MKKRYQLLVFISCALASVPAFAWDIDVDAIISMLGKMYGYQTAEELPQLKEIKTNTENTVNQLKDVNKNLSGISGYENLLNDMKNRKWSDDKWTEALNSAGSSAFKETQRRYDNLYPVNDDKRKDSQLNKTYYTQSSQITRTALAASAYSYDTLNEHMEMVNGLLKKLATSTTEKQVADLNARLLAEISFIQLEMLKQQNIQTQLIAMQSQSEVNGSSDAQRFNQWQPKK